MTNGFYIAISCEIIPKGKNPKSTKKVINGSVPRRLFNEESNYKEEATSYGGE